MVEKVLQLNNEKTIFWTLLGILFFCAGFYMYCINTTVHNVVFRQNLESEASQLTLTIGNQEFTYISKRNAITLELAYAMGFADAQDKTFISKNTGAQVSVLPR